MVHDRRIVSFVTQNVQRRDGREDGDGDGLLVVRPQSVFSRLGPKVSGDVCDPPYAPQSVGNLPLPGMIFGCTSETYNECLTRQLFGLPGKVHKLQVMRIAPGASIFLFDFYKKVMYGIFEATSHGGVHIVREAFGGKYDAQVKIQLVEDCPVLHEREFKHAIRENYRDAKKFDFHLNEAQVLLFSSHPWTDFHCCSEPIINLEAHLRDDAGTNSSGNLCITVSVCSLKLLFRRKAVEDSPFSIDQNRGGGVVQFFSAGPQQARSSIQVISRVSKDDVQESRTSPISAPTVLHRVHASPSHTRSRSLGGLKVSICAQDKKYKECNSLSNYPIRHVVMDATRKEQLVTPVLKSKIINPDRQEVVEEGSPSRPGKEVVEEDFQSRKGISQDRKRRADASSYGVPKYSEQLGLREQDRETDEAGSGGHNPDLCEVLNLSRLNKKLKPSTKESDRKLLNTPTEPPAYTGGNIAIGGVLFINDSKRNSERFLPFSNKKHTTTSSGSLVAESSKDLMTSRTSNETDAIQETGKKGKTVRPVHGLHRKLKTAFVSGDDMVQSLTAAGKHLAKADTVEGRGATEAFGSENLHNIEPKTANCDGVGGCVDLFTDAPVKSAMLQQSNDEIIESGTGAQPKDGTLALCVSLNLERAENVRHYKSPLVLENHEATGHVLNCVLGKRTRGSKQDDPVLDSAMESQSLQAGTLVKQRKEGPKESHPEECISRALLTAPIVSDALHEREQGDHLPGFPLSGDQYFTSQVHTMNSSPYVENLSEAVMPVSRIVLPLNGVIPVVSTVIPSNIGATRSLGCRRHSPDEENGPSTSVQKLNKIEDPGVGCSYVTPDVSTPREGSALPGKDFQKHETHPLSSTHSSFSGKLSNLWDCRTLRYGKHRKLDTVANCGGRRSSKSRNEPTSTLEKSGPNSGSTKIWEGSVYTGRWNYDRQPVSPIATVASGTDERLENESALLVCDLENPGKLSLDRKMIGVDTKSDILSKHQPSAVASVFQQCMLSTEVALPSRLERGCPTEAVFQNVNTALVLRSDGLESLEPGKKIAILKGLPEIELVVSDKNCHPDDLPSLESVSPTIVTTNETNELLQRTNELLQRTNELFQRTNELLQRTNERIAYPSLLPWKEQMLLNRKPMPRRADAPQAARDPSVKDWLYARNRGSPSACTSTASLSGCSGHMGEPELEINTSIKEEELEICLPIEDDENMHAGPRTRPGT